MGSPREEDPELGAFFAAADLPSAPIRGALPGRTPPHATPLAQPQMLQPADLGVDPANRPGFHVRYTEPITANANEFTVPLWSGTGSASMINIGGPHVVYTVGQRGLQLGSEQEALWLGTAVVVNLCGQAADALDAVHVRPRAVTDRRAVVMELSREQRSWFVIVCAIGNALTFTQHPASGEAPPLSESHVAALLTAIHQRMTGQPVTPATLPVPVQPRPGPGGRSHK